jgi:hypothetical protein
MSRPISTIIAINAGRSHKLFKFWFGKDGSFYITAPYHTAGTATLLKRTARYDTGFGQLAATPADATIDVGLLDNDEARVKLSYHRSGFCQFSGPDVLSGIDEDGNIKGIGVYARALEAIGPRFGPAFIVNVYGLEDFATCETNRAVDVIFNVDDLLPFNALSQLPEEMLETPEDRVLPIVESLTIEGFYFNPDFRRFVQRTADGKLVIYNSHPTGVVIPLRVIAAQPDCDLPGFIGLYACRNHVRFETTSGFSINGPGENYRENAFGERLGDVISCQYPRLSFSKGRSLRYGSESETCPDAAVDSDPPQHDRPSEPPEVRA